MESVNILGIKIDKVTMPQAVQMIENFVRSRRIHFIATPNPEIIMTALRDPEYKTILNNTDLSLADGIGIIWASKVLAIKKLKGFSSLFNPLIIIGKALISLLAIIFWQKLLYTELPERITGVDLVAESSKLASEKGFRVYFLGGMPGVADKASKKLKFLYPALKIAGVYAGYPGENGLADRIRVARPDILFVAYGSPKQEKFIAKNLIKMGVPVAIGVGGAFDFISGKIPRAPSWIRRLGLEWFYRFLCEPAKRINRILIAFPRFACTVVWYKIKN